MWRTRARTRSNALAEFTSIKLVVASGLTSVPDLPTLPNKEAFRGPVYHHRDFGNASRTIFDTPECKNVAVLGAGKSATDMVYEAVKKGKNVSWIIRKSGEGLALIFTAPPSTAGGRYWNSTEQGATRFNALFSPSSFMSQNWVVRLIHGTQTGRSYLSRKCKEGDEGCRSEAAYRDREEASPGFKDLEPSAA